MLIRFLSKTYIRSIHSHFCTLNMNMSSWLTNKTDYKQSKDSKIHLTAPLKITNPDPGSFWKVIYIHFLNEEILAHAYSS